MNRLYVKLLLVVVLRLGRMSVFAGMPGRLFGKQVAAVVGGGGGGTPGVCIDEWHRCVKHVTVSSRENQAHHLIEGQDGYWQSAGTQGKVSIRSQFNSIQSQVYIWRSFLLMSVVHAQKYTTYM